MYACTLARCTRQWQKFRFDEYRLRDFVESSPLARWCPYPDCTYAVLVRADRNQADEVNGMDVRMVFFILKM